MRTTGLVEIISIIGLSLCRSLQMLGTHGVCVLESSSIICVHAYTLYLPHVHAQGVKQLSVVVVVRTKIACLGDLGT